MNIYDFTVKAGDGSDVPLKNYQGKVLLIVNTAVGCGFAPQYNDLQNLYEEYKTKGLEILDFPCNQFGNQSPGSNEEIADVCSSRYGITFQQFEKIDVNGENGIPLYRWLKEQKGGIGGDKIKWNFTKFLVNKRGEVVGRYAPTKKPKSLTKDIIKLLEE